MRRRLRDIPQEKYGIPANLIDFNPEEWPGRSEYQRWAAWDEARQAWATANLPSGVEDLPAWAGVVPDQPWDEVEL